jgi:hypothetical protein
LHARQLLMMNQTGAAGNQTISGNQTALP